MHERIPRRTRCTSSPFEVQDPNVVASERVTAYSGSDVLFPPFRAHPFPSKSDSLWTTFHEDMSEGESEDLAR
jgi:hypothetical protein